MHPGVEQVEVKLERLLLLAKEEKRRGTTAVLSSAEATIINATSTTMSPTP